MLNELFYSHVFLICIFLIMVSALLLLRSGHWEKKIKFKQQQLESPIVESYERAKKTGNYLGEYEDWLSDIGKENQHVISLYGESCKSWGKLIQKHEFKLKILHSSILFSAIVLLFSVIVGLNSLVSILQDVPIEELKKVSEIKKTYELELKNSQNKKEVKELISSNLSYLNFAIASDERITTTEYSKILDEFNIYRLKNFRTEYRKFINDKKQANTEDLR